MLSMVLAAGTAFGPCGQRLRAPTLPAHVRSPSVAMQGDLFKGLTGALGNVAGSALEKIQQAASEGAMQEENLWAKERAEKVALDPAMAQPLPDSFEDAVELALKATSEALADGSNRLVIEFDTSAGDETYNLLSRTQKLVEPFLPRFEREVLLPPLPSDDDEPAGPRLQVLFPDEGTAAFVAQKWELPAGTKCGSMPRGKFVAGVEALLVVAPGATEVPGLQRILREVEEQAFDTPVVLFNPKLVDMQSTGYGLVGRELRTMVETEFNNCFTLKSYPEGALYKVHPYDYTVWREEATAEGGYMLVYQGQRRPSGDEITDILYPDDEDGGGGGDMMAGLGSFIKGFQAM